MEILGNAFMPKLCPKYVCVVCDYRTSKKSSYDNHIQSVKHASNVKGNKMEILGNAFMPKLCSVKFVSCEKCNKNFKSSSGLWKHKNKGVCFKNTHEENNNKEESSDKQLIMMLIKENSELRKEQTDIKELILEIVKNGTHNTNTITHTNSHNKAFNLNFFLNETCKNAMNITDFVDSIKLQLSDLMDVGELGYVEGISKIIVKNLNNLDETIRPIHCTDKKRETMYIKDEGQWEKDENKVKLKKVVKKIANKNIRLLPEFREKYPEYSNSSNKISDTYDKIVVESMTSDEDKNEKIAKNISRVTTIGEK
jgi:hypothetical protein